MTGNLRKVAVITGASGGIGADLARVMAKDGVDLALVARSEAALNALADEIAATGSVRPLVIAADLAEIGAADRLLAALRQADAVAESLVNNAGYGLNGWMQTLNRADQVGIIDLNVRALTDLTLALLPDIIANRGGILNVASTAAFLPGPGMAVYYASKAYVVSLSQAMGAELGGQVRVSALCPGPVATGFMARAGFDANLLKVYKPMSSYDVAVTGYAGFKQGKRVIVPGVLNKLTVWSAPFTPKAILLPLVKWLQAKRNRA